MTLWSTVVVVLLLIIARARGACIRHDGFENKDFDAKTLANHATTVDDNATGSHAPTEPAALDPLYQRMAELVTPYGYPLEQHFVTTTDGYILRLFRIPSSPAKSISRKVRAVVGARAAGQLSTSASAQGREGAASSTPAATFPWNPDAPTSVMQPAVAATLDAPSRKPLVYLQHGLLDSSAGFVVNPPGQGLAFILADAGGYQCFDGWCILRLRCADWPVGSFTGHNVMFSCFRLCLSF